MSEEQKKDVIKQKTGCEKHTFQGEIGITCRFRSLESKARLNPVTLQAS